MSADKPFEVVEDLNEESSVNSELADSFTEQALADGYPKELIDDALKYVTEDIDTYEKFESISIEKALKEIENKKHQEESKERRLAKSAQIAMDKVLSIADPCAHLESLIFQKYNTTAVTTLDLIERAGNAKELKLDLYYEPMYSLIIQIDSGWVKSLVKECLEIWKTDKSVNEYVGQYMKESGTTDTKKLLELLPDVIMKEDSPVEYKLFRAVQLARRQEIGDEVVDLDYVSDDAFINYNDTLDDAFKGNTPFLMAEITATEQAIQDMSPDERKSLFENAGTLYGKVIKFRYDASRSFDDAMRSSLGEYYPTWRATKDDRIAERKAKKQEKEKVSINKDASDDKVKIDKSSEREEAKSESDDKVSDKVKISKEEDTYSENKDKQDFINTSRSKGYTKPKDPINIGPNWKDIPYPFVIAGVHVVLSLLLWLILGKQKLPFIIATLGVTSAGFFLLSKEKTKGFLMVALGYVLTFIVIIL